MENLVNFWKGKRVLITGHTGFKGSWLSLFLHTIKADVYGISLPIKKNVITFNSMGLNENIVKSFFFDITNKELLEEHINIIKPDFIFHLAAQSLVRYSYENPIET